MQYNLRPLPLYWFMNTLECAELHNRKITKIHLYSSLLGKSLTGPPYSSVLITLNITTLSDLLPTSAIKTIYSINRLFSDYYGQKSMTETWAHEKIVASISRCKLLHTKAEKRSKD